MRLSQGWIPVLVAALLLGGCATQQSGGSSGGGSSGGGSSDGGSSDGGSSGSSMPSGGGSTGSGMPSGGGSTGSGMPSGDGSTGGGMSMPSGGVPDTGQPGTPGTAGDAAGQPDGSGEQEGATGAAGSEGAAGTGPELPSGTAQTPEERRAAVDRRLDDSLGTFDERIRKEQEGVAKERESNAASGAGAGVLVAQTGSDSGGRPGDLKSDRDSASTQGGSQGSQGGQAGAGSEGPARTSAGTGGSGKAAVERADGSDDDIVARRLRRAAEQETDPELKEKLWKEYDEYKRSVRGG